MGLQANAQAHEPVVFDSQMLIQGESGMAIDTSRFEHPDRQAPGIYTLDILVNGQWRGSQDIELRGTERSIGALACYNAGLLARIGIDLARSRVGQGADRQRQPVPERDVCVDLDTFVPGGVIKVDLAEQKMLVTVPEYYLSQSHADNDVDPASWDGGVTAGRLNYNVNMFTSQSRGRDDTSAYSGLDLGINVGALQLRHTANLTWSSALGGRYQAGDTYIQTDLTSLKSQLRVGESATNGELFDAVSFRGVQIESDDRMLPEYQRFYAPVIRGTASSNAKVTVYQRKLLVYETTVAPGPFEIVDLKVASFGGDLQVIVTQANGRTETFTVPFATTVQLLRPSSTRYSLMLGQVVDHGRQGGSPTVMQATLQQGLDNDLTGYGGLVMTPDYLSTLAGSAVNTRVGGFALDLTLAKAALPHGQERQGSSIRLSYSKNLPESQTHFSLLAYRYSTSGFLGLHDAILLQDALGRYPEALDYFGCMQSRLDANVSQGLGPKGGHLYLNGSSTRYWGRSGATSSFAMGYSNQWHGNTFSISAQRTRSVASGSAYKAQGQTDTMVTLSLSIPLGKEDHGGAVFNTFASHDARSGTQVTSGLSGTMDEAANVSYAASATHAGQSRTDSANASLSYRMPQVTLGASLSQGRDYRQGSMSASGAMLVHSGGATFSQTLGETVALVQASGAKGAAVGYSGSRIDSRGYAVLTSLTPYQRNQVDIDPLGMPDDIEMPVSSRSVAPRSGAVVKLQFPTHKSRPLLINSLRANGERLPFAATAIDVQSGVAIGAVGQGSRLVVRTDKTRGSIRVEWGPNPDQQCVVDYLVPESSVSQGLQQFDLVCHPVDASGSSSKSEAL
ncbi:TPA: fimbrial biogenesis outer membrane usher protein [Pseudomonas putida]|nr:fimbrial biogenesis outer membrane usher protein [Pseudomonas putida]